MSTVVIPNRATSTPDGDLATGLLRSLADLLARRPTGSFAEMLIEMAARFGAQGAGIAGPGRPTVSGWIRKPRDEYPWTQRAEAVWTLAEGGETRTLTDGDSSWLLWFRPRAQGLWVLWLNDTAARRWSESEAAALALAGLALVGAGWIDEGRAAGEPVDQRLEQAAQITSRLSHDFGNLLTGVLGFSELALAQVHS